jgi:hypothetical protein
MLWLLSILVALARMEVARGVVLAIDRDATADTAWEQIPVVSAEQKPVRPSPPRRF